LPVKNGRGKSRAARGHPATGDPVLGLEPTGSVSPASHVGTMRDSVRSGTWNQQLAAAMLLPRPDRETRRVDDPDGRGEALWGFAAALPPSLVLCGIVLLVLAALG
jgi:hypothetical protein